MNKTLLLVVSAILIIFTLADKCDNKANKKMGQYYEKLWKKAVHRRNHLQIKCQQTKDQKFCKAVELLKPKIAFLKKESHAWTNKCKIAIFKQTRRQFYKYMKETKKYGKMAAELKAKYEVLKKKAVTEGKLAAEDEKAMKKHLNSYKKNSELYAKFLKLAKKYHGEHIKLFNDAKLVKKDAELYVKKAAMWNKKAAELLKKLNVTRVELKKYQETEKQERTKAKEAAKKATAAKKLADEETKKAKAEKKTVEVTKTEKSKLQAKFQKRIQKNPVYKKHCSKRVKKCAKKYGWEEKDGKFKKCAGKCF